MKKILIAYGTTEGQTEKIADVIADSLRGRGLDATMLDLRDSQDEALDAYDGVIVGGSIHVGKHDKRVVDFVEKNRGTLTSRPSAFFSVSLDARSATGEAEKYVDEFEEQTGWRPAKVALFAGALLFTQYGFVKRLMMKRIAAGKPGTLGTDTSRDYVYTEWDGVRRFAEDFAAGLSAPGA
ncbi:flavodoxin domain-containing protein [Sinomonas sp. ASV486]|uniref:flavodoxin domain-containing protein n=1 Tax=Sinomonas sp. ASV486 TaxID=3051170 RepID=UPI0027DE0C57|nr:flavodoxin domain-containing protein [Sinomonas sp. ASV486]MDQ4491884.1 flavodoxin domain-containing protein [Sinomonas sp. ASV486]